MGRSKRGFSPKLISLGNMTSNQKIESSNLSGHCQFNYFFSFTPSISIPMVAIRHLVYFLPFLSP